MIKKSGECYLCGIDTKLHQQVMQFRTGHSKKKWICAECTVEVLRHNFTFVCESCGDNFVASKKRELCYFCNTGLNKRELWRVKAQNMRTSALGLQSDLTLMEWWEIILKYKLMCAYCGDEEFEEMDHIWPVSKGGGTTKTNVVPACHNCNSSKWTTF